MKVIYIKNVRKEDLNSFLAILRKMPLLYTENIVQYSILHKTDEYLVYTMQEYESSLFSLHNELIGVTYSATNILYEIIKAISIFYDNNIIHGNIKPTNILLGVDHHWYLTDYGLNMMYMNLPEEGGGIMKQFNTYNINYISPELLNGKEYSFYTDIWSFGCVLIFLLTGKNPFGNESVENTKRRIMKCEWTLPNYQIDELYSIIIMSTMCLNKKDRKNIEEIRSLFRFKDNMSIYNIYLIYLIEKRKEILPLYEYSTTKSYIINPSEISIPSPSSLASSSTSSSTTTTPKSINNNYLKISINSNLISNYEEITSLYITNLINKYNNITSTIKLDWRSNIIVTEMNIKTLINELKKKNQLNELIFRNCKFHIDSNTSKVFIKSLTFYKSLTKIDLSNNEINDEDIFVLSKQFEHLPQLLSLNLSNNIFRSNGFLYLFQSFRFISQLRELGLSKLNMNEYCFKWLCNNLNLINNIEKLDLSYNNLIGNDMKYFTEYLSNISHLQSLNIGSILLLLLFIK